jgi:hypothetical protein
MRKRASIYVLNSDRTFYIQLNCILDLNFNICVKICALKNKHNYYSSHMCMYILFCNNPHAPSLVFKKYLVQFRYINIYIENYLHELQNKRKILNL